MKIQLTNFRKYANQVFTFQPGTTIIVGENGAGKSSILMAFYFVLFTYGSPSLHLHGSKSCKVALDDGEYVITRSRKPNTLSLTRKKDGVQFHDHEAQGIINLKYGTSFDITSYMSQLKDKSYLHLNGADRIAFIEQFLTGNSTFNTLSGMKEKLKATSLEDKQTLHIASGEHAAAVRAKSKWELDRLPPVNPPENCFMLSAEELQEQLDTISSELMDARSLKVKIQNTVARIEEESLAIRELENDLDTTVSEFPITTANEELKQLRSDLNIIVNTGPLTAEIQKLDSRLQILTTYRNNVQPVLQPDTRTILDQAKERDRRRKLIVCYLDELSTLNQGVELIGLPETKMVEFTLNGVLPEYKEILAQSTLKCPECNTSIFKESEVAEKITKLRAKLQEVITFNFSDVTVYDRLITMYELCKIRDRMDVLNLSKETEEEALQSFMHSVDERVKNHRRYEDIRAELLEEETKYFEYKKLVHEEGCLVETRDKYKLALEKLGKPRHKDVVQKDVDDLELRIYQARMVKEKREHNIAQIRARKLTLASHSKILEKLEGAASRLRDEEFYLQQQLELGQELTRVRDYVLHFHQYTTYLMWKKNFDDTTEELKRKTQEVELATNRCKLNARMKSLIEVAAASSMEQFIGEINSRAGTLIEAILPESGLEICIGTTTGVSVTCKNVETNLGGLCGGEIAAVDLAYTLALHLSTGGSLLLLDECLGCFHDDTVERVVEVLRESFGTNQYVLLVGHRMVDGMFDHKLEV